MIANLWEKVRLICGNHDKDKIVYMEPHAASSSSVMQGLYGNAAMNMFYACPKYYPDKREEGETLCRNHISLKEYEGMLDYLSSIIEEVEADGGSIDLVGEKWKSKKGVEFEVVYQDATHIDIRCIDRRSLWKK